jgi:hypothetical protein
MKNSFFLVKKVYRYIRIYGVIWTLFKVAGRFRKIPAGLFFIKRKKPRVGIIGCGQFSYSTTANFLYRRYGNVIHSCFDIDENAVNSFSKSLRIKNSYTNFDDFASNNLDVVYIASNHSTHTDYAINLIDRGIKKIYIEKPIAVNEQQLKSLSQSLKDSDSQIYAGFNRPFSQGIDIIKSNIIDKNQKFFTNMIIWGHTIDQHHWYRNPEEGSRISGNLGHWIDLMIHILFWKKTMPEFYDISIKWLDIEKYTDENFIMAIKTSNGDIFNFQFGARVNPFDGVSELIDFQCNNFCSRIADFTKIELDNGDRRKVIKFFPKDAGHKNAVLQPFEDNYRRDFNEVLLSTALTILLGNIFKDKKAETRIFSKEIKSMYI